MEKYICLRDDDTNYFTDINELIDGYGCLWGQIPITLGVVPFSHGSQGKMYEMEVFPNKYKALRNWELNATPEMLSDYHKLHPVGDNQELVKELKRLIHIEKLEIAQHGVSHRYNEFGPETTCKQLSLPSIRDGKEYLSKLFGKEIKTYIPPSNTLDQVCAKYIGDIGMNILSCGDVLYNNNIGRIMSNLLDPSYLKSKILRQTSRPIKYKCGAYLMTSITYNNYNSIEDIFNKVMHSLCETGFASITTHYMLLNENGWHGEYCEYRRNFRDLIEKLSKESGVTFVTAQQYFELLKRKFYNNK